MRGLRSRSHEISKPQDILLGSLDHYEIWLKPRSKENLWLIHLLGLSLKKILWYAMLLLGENLTPEPSHMCTQEAHVNILYKDASSAEGPVLCNMARGLQVGDQAISKNLKRCRVPGPHCKYIRPGIWVPVMKIRWLWDTFIFIMGIPILVRQHLHIEKATRAQYTSIP